MRGLDMPLRMGEVAVSTVPSHEGLETAGFWGGAAPGCGPFRRRVGDAAITAGENGRRQRRMARKAGRKRLLFFLYFLVFGGVAANVLRGALQAGTTGGSILGIGRIGVDKANPAYIREAQRLFLDYSQPIGQYSLAQNLGYVYSFAVTRGFGSVRYVTNDLPVGWNQMTVTAREFTSAYLDVGIRDRERTREWYQSVFDAEVKPHPRMLQLYLDDSEIHFPETPNPAYLKSNHFAVEVADWEGMMAHLAALDIPFDDGLGRKRATTVGITSPITATPMAT